jgi:hypothetical protein
MKFGRGSGVSFSVLSMLIPENLLFGFDDISEEYSLLENY